MEGGEEEYEEGEKAHQQLFRYIPHFHESRSGLHADHHVAATRIQDTGREDGA